MSTPILRKIYRFVYKANHQCLLTARERSLALIAKNSSNILLAIRLGHFAANVASLLIWAIGQTKIIKYPTINRLIQNMRMINDKSD